MKLRVKEGQDEEDRQRNHMAMSSLDVAINDIKHKDSFVIQSFAYSTCFRLVSKHTHNAISPFMVPSCDTSVVTLNFR